MVCALAAEVVHGDGVLQGLHTRLQTEGDFGVTHRVSTPTETDTQKAPKQNKNGDDLVRKCTCWAFLMMTKDNACCTDFTYSVQSPNNNTNTNNNDNSNKEFC